MICSLLTFVTAVLHRILPEKIRFALAAGLVRKYRFSYIIEDGLGILSKRLPDDNFAFLVKSGQSCDAVDMMEQLTPSLEGAAVCFDIGANIGITTVWMARHARKVYAFEPEPSNLVRFREHMRLNRVDNVSLEPSAVSDHEGKATFNLTASYGHHSLGKVRTSPITGTIEVDLITVDSYCRSHNIEQIHFMKIDVEGFELEVLQGARQMLEGRKITLVVFEVSPEILAALSKQSVAIYDFLREAGYRICGLNNEPVDRHAFASLKANADFLAFPEPRQEEAHF